MVRARNKVDEAWSGIDVQLKRRHDLVPNLVEAVKGYAAHEAGVFAAVTEARAKAMSAQAQGPAAAGAAENVLSGALGRLFAIAEAYPELRATENFQQLQGELTNLESEIAASRRLYNGNVQTYNSKIQTFPGVALAGPFGFSKREFFEIEDEADREVPKVSFS
jgi:LemA protein